jgi:predicted RNase H-like HicB family nuclease
MTNPTESPAPGPDPALPNGGHPITIEVKVWLSAIAIPESVGGYSVIIPALRGCVTQGDTIEEVQENIVEAAEGWLASMHDRYRDEDLRFALEAL